MEREVSFTSSAEFAARKPKATLAHPTHATNCIMPTIVEPDAQSSALLVLRSGIVRQLGYSSSDKMTSSAFATLIQP